MITGTREGADAVTVTPIFDDLAAAWAATPEPTPEPTPGPRPGPKPALVGADAFGRGCLQGPAEEHAPPDDEVTRLLEGARREAVALGRRWVDTAHLALAAVRAGGDVGRVFGMRGVGPAVLLAALDDDEDRSRPDDPTGGDPVRPALSSVARTVLHRAAHSAAREGRAVTAGELAAAVARTGRVADLLTRLGVDLDDLADALAVASPGPASDLGTVAVPTAPAAPTARTAPVRRAPVPVGVVAPVTVMLPTTGTTAATTDPGPLHPRAAGVPA